MTQVYKFDLIKMKSGPPITTGDMLVKLDSLIGQLGDLITLIVDAHRGTKLKRSQDCCVKGYKLLREKLSQS